MYVAVVKKLSKIFKVAILFTVFSSLTGQQLLAQDLIKGSIRDKSGLSVPFVNIVVESSQPYGTASNTEGRYSLRIRKNESPDATVKLTCIGYKLAA